MVPQGLGGDRHQGAPQTLTSLLTARASAGWGWVGELFLPRKKTRR